MLALNVVEPQSSGIGGGGFFVCHDAARRRLDTIDGREAAPKAADAATGSSAPTASRCRSPRGFPGGRASACPAALAAMAEAHERHGKLPWARLFEPAIRLARDGFVVTPRLHNGARSVRHATSLGPAEARAIPATRTASRLPVGTTLRNPALAATLEQLARTGPDASITGDNPRRIAAARQRRRRATRRT